MDSSPRGSSVKVKCFDCAALLEASDGDAVVDAFVSHGREDHAWPYPEQAIRNYARNYAEATERLTGSTQRLSEIGSVVIHPVTEERIDDWLRFFDRRDLSHERRNTANPERE